MTRPSQIALVLVVFVNGALLATWRAAPEAATLGVIVPAGLLVILSAAAVHLVNESADAETDRLTARTPFSGGSGALALSQLAPTVPLRLGLGLAALVVVVTLPVAFAGLLAPAATGLLLLGLLGGLAYSLPPVAAMRRGWGEPLNALLGALILPLFGVSAVAGRVEAVDVIAFAPFTFVAFASVLATAWPDRIADAATGKHTLQARLAPRNLVRLALGANLAFVVSTALSMATGAMPFAAAGLVVTPLLVVGLVRYTHVATPIANVAAMVGLAILTAVVLTVGIASSGGST